MTELFEFFKRGDHAPCFYCDKPLTFLMMRPSNWGPQYRENVCAECREEEIANGGWMLRDPESVARRQHPVLQVLPSDDTRDLPKLSARLRVASWVRDRSRSFGRGALRLALRGLRQAQFVPSPKRRS